MFFDRKCGNLQFLIVITVNKFIEEHAMIYSKVEIGKQIEDLGILENDTLLIHSSMKAIGEVVGGADEVLDAFIEHLSNGLLIFPTHTWAQMNEKYDIFNPLTEPSCVGFLSNLFMKRTGVIRSLHPTHSVAALGKEAVEYVQGEEQWETPCPRNGCWGKLYDRGAKILFIGCDLTKNTIIHGVEEWNQIPQRLTENYRLYKVLLPDGILIERPSRDHYHASGDISQNYGKLEGPLLRKGIAKLGRIGDAKAIICDAKEMVDLTTSFLKKNPDLFVDKTEIPVEWYT
jgi:aminoglycoside 3-N-acetyltransferase